MKKLIIDDLYDFGKDNKFSSFIKEHFTEKITDEIQYSKDLNAILMHQNYEYNSENEVDMTRILLLHSLADYSLKATYFKNANIINDFFNTHKDAILYLDFPTAPQSIPNVKLNGKITLKNDVLTIPLKIIPDDCSWCFMPVNGANFRGPTCDFCGGDLDHGGGHLTIEPWKVLDFLCLELRKNNYPFDVLFSEEHISTGDVNKLIKGHKIFVNTKHLLTSRHFVYLDSKTRFNLTESKAKDSIDFLLYMEESEILFIRNNKVVCSIDDKNFLFECDSYNWNYLITSNLISVVSKDDSTTKMIINIINKVKEKVRAARIKRTKSHFKEKFKLFKQATNEIAKKQRKNYTNIVHADYDGVLRLAYNQTFNQTLIIADDVIQIGSKLNFHGMPAYARTYYCFPDNFYATFSTISELLTHINIQMGDSVKTIESGGFWFKNDTYIYLESLNISKNVTVLKPRTFNSFVNKIYFGENIKTIGDECFLWLPNEIFYNGSSSNFSKYGQNWFAIREHDKTTVIHCNDKDLFI